MARTTGTSAERRLFLLSLALSAAFLMETLDSTILVAALPAIAADFGVPVLSVNLAVSLYLMVMAATIPASGWLADRLGAKRLFLGAMVAFMLTSLGAALATDLQTLVAMRILQAIAGALMTPVGRLLLIRNAPPDQLAAAIAWMSMPALVGPILGPLVGGYLVTYASWQWVFAVKLPFGIAGLILASRLLPADQPRPAQRFDSGGFLYCAVVLGAAQLLLEQLVHGFLSSEQVAVLLFSMALALLAAGRHFRRCANPVLDPRLLHLPLFRTALFAGGLSRLGLNALPFLLQLQLQLGFGWSAARAGWVVLCIALSALLLKPLMRLVLSRYGFRRTLAGNAALAALTMVLLAGFSADAPWPPLVLVVLVFGVSRSLQFNAINTLMYAEIPAAQQSASTTLGSVGQQLAMGLGISVAAVLVSQLQQLGVALPATAISGAMLAIAALTALSSGLFLSLAPDAGAAVSGAGIPKKA